MAILMGAVLVAVLVAGTAAFAGDPLSSIGMGAALAAAVLLLARRRDRRAVTPARPADREPRR